MKIKDFKKLLESYHNMQGFTPTISKARKTNKCDACGRKILQGSFYISLSLYANLWYRFHFSTICRAKGYLAREWLIDHTELTVMKDQELIEQIDNFKPNNTSDEIAQEWGFKNRLDIITQIRNSKHLPYPHQVYCN